MRDIFSRIIDDLRTFVGNKSILQSTLCLRCCVLGDLFIGIMRTAFGPHIFTCPVFERLSSTLLSYYYNFDNFINKCIYPYSCKTVYKMRMESRIWVTEKHICNVVLVVYEFIYRNITLNRVLLCNAVTSDICHSTKCQYRKIVENQEIAVIFAVIWFVI